MGIIPPRKNCLEKKNIRDQREWIFKVREVKSENKNAFTLFRELKSEIKMLRDRDREVKILEDS